MNQLTLMSKVIFVMFFFLSGIGYANELEVSRYRTCWNLYKVMAEGKQGIGQKAHVWNQAIQFVDQLVKSDHRLFLRKNSGHIKPLWDVSRISAYILGVPRPVVVLERVDELKYLPFTLDGTDLLLLFNENHQAGLEKQKISRVVNVAKAKKIVINVAYINSPNNQELDPLASESGGNTLYFDSKTSDLCRNMSQNFSR